MKRLSWVVVSIILGAGGCVGPRGNAEGDGWTAPAGAGPQMRPPEVVAPAAGDDPELVAGAGAADPSSRAYRLKKSDPVVINFQGIPTPLTIEDVVDENGMITLPYIGAIRAEGCTSSDLEAMVHDKYVPDFYRYLNVYVLMPTQRSYFVNGAVRAPGKYPYSAGITLLQAITTAAGYNDYAQPRRVKILREGQTTEYDMIDIQNTPEMDVPVEPGDVIIVPQKWY